MEELVLSVTGMDCRSCGERIERSLRKLEGVRRASADHGCDTVRVVIEPPGSLAAVRASIAAAGFEVA